MLALIIPRCKGSSTHASAYSQCSPVGLLVLLELLISSFDVNALSEVENHVFHLFEVVIVLLEAAEALFATIETVVSVIEYRG